MKKVILNFEIKSNNFKELVQEAFNKNFLNFLVSQETFKEFEKIDRVILYSRDFKIPSKYLVYDNKKELEENSISKRFPYKSAGIFIDLKSKEDERDIIKLSKKNLIDFIIVSAKDWRIIPFENLIAEMHSYDTELIAAVDTIKEAELMLKILEIGVDGLLITVKKLDDILEIKNLIHNAFQIKLTRAKIVKIENISEAERVCIDTTSLFNIGEGLLVGSTAAGFCLIHSETIETEFVASRPFRVNAGDVSSYILVPDDDPEKVYKTNYLSELKGGKKVLAVSNKGVARVVTIGRIKIETRPMLRFELEVLKEGKIIPISCICQNAETNRLVDTNGNAKSVVDIRIGDEVLVHIGPGATHFGTAIKETIIEK
ncbi:MAG: 3-dehydroquinate synthase II [Candidatus Hermodarchaeota archaeon]